MLRRSPIYRSVSPRHCRDGRWDDDPVATIKLAFRKPGPLVIAAFVCANHWNRFRKTKLEFKGRSGQPRQYSIIGAEFTPPVLEARMRGKLVRMEA
jgi:hypothetical protein